MTLTTSPWSRGLAAALIAATITGCSTDPIQVAQGSTAERALGGSEVATIAPGDRVRLTVFGDQQMSGEYGVDDAGAISVPLAGPVAVAGKTPVDAAKAIAGVLRTMGLYRDPRVTVEVMTLAPFYILGEVNRPGEYPYRPGMSLFAAVATAGGYTYRADKATVYIRKSTENVERAYELNADIAVMPGDRIRIPERYF
ncbi:MAG: polysaccharide export protein [Alphaproteobacteria bacterium]|nr:polysaccharide export protein [Alphaproteobacteria bacterium]